MEIHGWNSLTHWLNALWAKGVECLLGTLICAMVLQRHPFPPCASLLRQSGVCWGKSSECWFIEEAVKHILKPTVGDASVLWYFPPNKSCGVEILLEYLKANKMVWAKLPFNHTAAEFLSWVQMILGVESLRELMSTCSFHMTNQEAALVWRSLFLQLFKNGPIGITLEKGEASQLWLFACFQKWGNLGSQQWWKHWCGINNTENSLPVSFPVPEKSRSYFMLLFMLIEDKNDRGLSLEWLSSGSWCLLFFSFSFFKIALFKYHKYKIVHDTIDFVFPQLQSYSWLSSHYIVSNIRQ